MNDPEMDTTVEWRFLPWSRDHMVSADGRVMKRRSQHDTGPGLFRELKQACVKGGYRTATINTKPWFVHRLVYVSHVGELVDGLVICHLDGNPSNNSATNLLQDTRAVNMSHCLAHGTDRRGQKAETAKHDDATARRVMAAIQAAEHTPSGRLKNGVVARIAVEHGATCVFVKGLSSTKSRAWPHIKANAKDALRSEVDRRIARVGEASLVGADRRAAR